MLEARPSSRPEGISRRRVARNVATSVELDFAYLQAHERHMRHIYGLRLASLGLAALCIIIGAIMTFYGLEGSFDWAIEAPSTAGAKLTNASPGIVFATVGMLIGLLTVSQKPVGFSTGGEGISLGAAELSETAQKERRA